MISTNYLNKDVKTPQTQFYGIDSKSVSYANARALDVVRVKELLKLGCKAIFPSKNNWCVINGETFNGFTREQIEEMESVINERNER